MNIYDHLKNEHARVKELFTEILSHKDSNNKLHILASIKAELLLHARAEELSFYKELMKHENMKQSIGHAMHEHDEVKKMLINIEKQDPMDSNWLNSIKELKKEVEHHVHEEETNIFASAKKIFDNDQARQFVDDFIKAKEKVKKGMTTEKAA